VRGQRDSLAVENALARLKLTAADPGQNLMPPLIDCARAYCTEGEMVLALQEVFGAYTESPVF
jgi:methylmalonyl-CoA mutase N-terminal domain/subunit